MSTNEIKSTKDQELRQTTAIKEPQGMDGRDGHIPGWNKSFPLGQHWLLLIFQAKLCQMQAMLPNADGVFSTKSDISSVKTTNFQNKQGSRI